MFRKPEELIMAVLGALWLVATYFLADYATYGSLKYVLMITGFTAIWAIISFVLWKHDRWMAIWPILLGALVACWWPWLDWFALKDILPATQDAFIVLPTPWYASWMFKSIIALIPMILGWIVQYRLRRERQLLGKF